MHRARETELIPRVSTRSTDSAVETAAMMIAHITENRIIIQVPEGMSVIDGTSEEQSDVAHLRKGEPDAARISRASQYDPSLIEAFFGMGEPDMAEPLRSRPPR